LRSGVTSREVEVLRYDLDEDVEGPVACQLRRHGIDAVSANELGRAGKRIIDREQLSFAVEDGRTLVTHDRHFVALGGEVLPHAGVILLQRPMSIGEIVEYLDLTARLMTPDEIRNLVHFCDW
jgi:predicted nuclease of predicted toxin-antitoxin system